MAADKASWEFKFKACAALTAVITALSIVLGGVAALVTFYQQTEAAEVLKRKELRQAEYNQKREIYYELVDAASAAAASVDIDDARRKAANFWRMYLGKAHIAVIDQSVYEAKKEFSMQLRDALAKGQFPTDDLDSAALNLSRAAREVLRAENLFEGPSTGKIPGDEPARERARQR